MPNEPNVHAVRRKWDAMKDKSRDNDVYNHLYKCVKQMCKVKWKERKFITLKKGRSSKIIKTLLQVGKPEASPFA